MGVVVRHGRPEVVTGSDDSEPHVRERRNRTRRSSHRYWRRPVQNNEGG